HGETLCGACKDICPVNIDIPRMLLALRQKFAEGDPQWNATPASLLEKTTYKTWSLLTGNRTVYDIFLRLAGWGQKALTAKDGMIHRLPFPLNGWTQSRDIKPVASKTFIDRWKEMKLQQK
ncbi:MAG: DUF3390 domain-containing protein, partial [Deltaproteobacteria bacterium]